MLSERIDRWRCGSSAILTRVDALKTLKMPEEISIEERIETRLSKLFSFSLFYRYDARSRGGDRNEHPSSIVEREESEVDSASSCSPKHIHRPRCERNFTGYIDKRAGSQVGQPGGGAGGEGGRRRGTRKKRAVGGRSYSGFSSYILFYLKLTKRNEYLNEYWLFCRGGAPLDSRHFSLECKYSPGFFVRVHIPPLSPLGPGNQLTPDSSRCHGGNRAVDSVFVDIARIVLPTTKWNSITRESKETSCRNYVMTWRELKCYSRRFRKVTRNNEFSRRYRSFYSP